ncbi:3-oxoacyl-[acyl-carrier-protein] reductase FabG [Trametes pubescens]|uniref:3-oxoacyl-[acyl-carrier-protein] reductase FabG n=1 Tax=Trametes pubescens TaxID=154538 RepID=A0A1M2VFS4_TRAPU|nr:3-oxoacyl-[acyl-carrier-protein] reductase FabG [Trametes pubescens]
MPSLVWLITGTSSGIGRELALAALKRGDKVIATGRKRSLAQVEELKAHGADVLELDVTAPLDQLKQVAQKAVAIHGRVDIVVNNAARKRPWSNSSTSYLRCIASCRAHGAPSVFSVGLFGGLNVARAFLPYLRKQRSGMIIWNGSLCGWV